MEALVVLAILVVIVALFVVASYVKGHPENSGASTVGSGLLGAGFDEAFNPHAVNARGDIDREKRLIVEASAPDDDLGIAGGTCVMPDRT